MKRLRPLWIFSFLLLFTILAFALTLAKASLEELTRESVIIAHGRVVGLEARWENPSHTAIETAVRFQVDEYLKGSGPAELEVVQMGGRIGDFGDVVPGTPHLVKGQELVLFLQSNRGKLEIHSIALGCFRVITKEDGSKYVMNDLRNINLVDPETGREIQPEDALTYLPLHTFLSQVRALVEKK